jgi:hypothetical protein
MLWFPLPCGLQAFPTCDRSDAADIRRRRDVGSSWRFPMYSIVGSALLDKAPYLASFTPTFLAPNFGLSCMGAIDVGLYGHR